MSFFRNVAFFLKGSREFTRAGYERAAKSFDPADANVVGNSVPPEVPCVSIVTGANSGIGLACATALARRGDQVHLVCRNEQRAKEACENIVRDTNNSNVHVHVVDLCEPKQVSAFCSKFKNAHSALNVLVNNAGCMVNTRSLNSEGLEVNFATNTLATYLITNLLLPALKASRDPRVITVSSGGMLTQKLNSADPSLRDQSDDTDFDGTSVYAQNKRQQVVMTEVWAEDNPDIFFASMHPGWTDTPAVATSMPSFYERMKTRLRTPEQGADTAVWLATMPRVCELTSGDFFLDRAAVAKHLTMAGTRSSPEERRVFMEALAKIAAPYVTSS